MPVILKTEIFLIAVILMFAKLTENMTPIEILKKDTKLSLLKQAKKTE